MSLEQQFIELTRQFNLLREDFDNLVKPEVGRWQDWTPTVTQSAAITITASLARYKLSGDTIQLVARLVAQSGGVAGNAIVVGSLPATISHSGAGDTIGNCQILLSGPVTYYPGNVVPITTTTLQFRRGDTLGTSYIGIDPNIAIAANDQIAFYARYERV